MATARPAIIEFDLATGKREIKTAWHAYQKTEPLGLEFGRVCCEWRKKFKAQGKKGQGLVPILEQAGIPISTAYWWMERYQISIGEKEEQSAKTKDEANDYCQSAQDERREREKDWWNSLSDDQKQKAKECNKKEREERKERERRRQNIPNYPLNDLSNSNDRVVLRFVELLSLVALNAAWRVQTAIYHPDRGGNSQLAREFNGLWEQIKSARNSIEGLKVN